MLRRLPSGVNTFNSLSAKATFALVTLATLFLYALTLSAGYGFHDEAEYSLRAWQLGATHSPGSPLYVVLAYPFARLTGNPALATGIVSAISTALAAGLMALFLKRRLTPVIAVSGALLFAVNFLIWRNAVLSENYALSMLLVGLSLWFLIRAQEQGAERPPWLAVLLYSAALAAHFANILLLPAYLLLVVLFNRESGQVGAILVRTSAIIGGAVVVIGLSNVVLAQNQMPWDLNLPDSFSGLLRYMLGAQHDPLRINTPSFLLGRVVEHGGIILRQGLYVLPLIAVAGAIRSFREEWYTFVAMGAVAAIYLGYFTLFGSGDYFTMVAPAYFVLLYWTAMGIAELIRWIGLSRVWLTASVMLGVAGLAVIQQLPWRYAAARSPDAPRVIANLFARLPANSLAIVKYTEFTAMRYAQEIDGDRQDLRLILPAQGARTYAHGRVEDYFAYAIAASCERPVVTNRLDDRLSGGFETTALEGLQDWYLLRNTACANTGSAND